MNWTQDKSLTLSRICVGIFILALAVLCVSAPWLWRWILRYSVMRADRFYACYLATTYCIALPAAAALTGLWRLLGSIRRDQVFTAENVARLRMISWSCIAAALIFLASAAYDWLFFILAAAAAFIGLILRVVKNVFAQAVRLKDENDYTI